MIEELTKKSEELSRKADKINDFINKYGIHSCKEYNNFIEELCKLEDSIPSIINPTNKEELLLSELKRRSRDAYISMELYVSGKAFDFYTYANLYGLSRSDLDALPKWLYKNKKEALEAGEHLFQTTGIENFGFLLGYDLPSKRKWLEELATADIQKYHKVLGKLLQEKTIVTEFLSKIKVVPTFNEASYFYVTTNTLAISIPTIYYSTIDRHLKLKERELIGQYGHEGMGHALNHLVTNSNNLPVLQKKNTTCTSPTAELLARFYQKIIFEDLKGSPEIQKDLGIKDIFDKIYEEEKNIIKLEDYIFKLSLYTIMIMTDESFGDPDEPEVLSAKEKLLSDVALNPNALVSLVEYAFNFYDLKEDGLRKLSIGLAYINQPIEKALEEFKKRGIFYDEKGRNKIDEVFLNGFWTPIGFIDNARLKAQELASYI